MKIKVKNILVMILLFPLFFPLSFFIAFIGAGKGEGTSYWFCFKEFWKQFLDIYKDK